MKRRLHYALLTVACMLTTQAWATDWPQFRYDAGRTAAAPQQLPDDLQLCWTRTLPTPRPAFPHELRLAYDATYEPVVLGHTMFVPSLVTDSVTAFDTKSGNQRWRFFAEGPVRFAPVARSGKVYFVSDDGYLYCLDADDGSLRWKFRGLPPTRADRKVLGHGRLVSLWPARGGPVVADGVVYFAAGLWPTEGIFVHAVDAETGEAVWSNTDSHLIPKSNWDHGIGHDSGLTPQGYLAIVGDRLVVPCGAQLPAFLNLKTGELQKYTMGWGGAQPLGRATTMETVPSLPQMCRLSAVQRLSTSTVWLLPHSPLLTTAIPPVRYDPPWRYLTVYSEPLPCTHTTRSPLVAAMSR